MFWIFFALSVIVILILLSAPGDGPKTLGFFLAAVWAVALVVHFIPFPSQDSLRNAVYVSMTWLERMFGEHLFWAISATFFLVMLMIGVAKRQPLTYLGLALIIWILGLIGIVLMALMLMGAHSVAKSKNKD